MMKMQYLLGVPQVSLVIHVSPLEIRQEDAEVLHYLPSRFHYR